MVWGDGKTEIIPANSETDDARLIGFGGSFTGDWVHVKLKDVLEWDKQAPRKIINVLDV